jgi:hypothetical protein
VSHRTTVLIQSVDLTENCHEPSINAGKNVVRHYSGTQKVSKEGKGSEIKQR